MTALFENNTIKVYLNSSEEVFVENKKSGVTLRISDHVKTLQITAAGCSMLPKRIGGSLGLQIEKTAMSIFPEFSNIQYAR